jgi:uncharacterized protein YdhG (YjbR/CyaY superfamily)
VCARDPVAGSFLSKTFDGDLTIARIEDGISMKPAKTVDEYIAAAAKETQPKLRKIRASIRRAVPEAVESISYGMPFYSYDGEVGFKNRLVYFGVQKSRLVLYMRPQDLEGHVNELAEYKSTKSALGFPLDQALPVSLIGKLVKEAATRHKVGEAAPPGKDGKRRSGRRRQPN